jgi:D-threo-aldose 1-dehydrogenase
MIAKSKIDGTEVQVSALGFGGAPLGGLLEAVDRKQAIEAVGAALNAGINYFDTAPFYGFGKSERLIGDRLRDRDDVTISTKVGRLLRPGLPEDPAGMGWPDPLPFHPVYDYSRDGILRSVEHSYQRLGLDRIDILYVHDIGAFTHGEDNARHMRDLEASGYRALDELRSSGEIGAIGLGVNEIDVCLDVLKFGDWDVFLLAGRYTLLEQNALDDLLPECLQRNTSIVVGGPYNSGILVGGNTWNYARAPEEILTRVRRMANIARDHGVELPAAALQFPKAHSAVASVIPGVRNTSEFADNLRLSRSVIPQPFWSDLKSANLLRPDAPVPQAPPFWTN